MRSFTRFAVTCLVVGVSSVSSAQSAARPTVPDSAKVLVGTWEGTYDSDHAGTGAMKIVIAKDSAFHATSLEFAMGGSMQAMPVHDFTVTTDDISWVQETMGTSCQATAVLKAGLMKGAVICGHGQVNFTLSKRS
jgi:hypothetical protein